MRCYKTVQVTTQDVDADLCLRQRYSMICKFRQRVPPPHTSHKRSTEKHVWLCVSSTAPGTEWLKTHRDIRLHIIHIRLDIRVNQIRLDITTLDQVRHSPHIAMNIAKATVPSLSNRWLTCVDTNT